MASVGVKLSQMDTVPIVALNAAVPSIPFQYVAIVVSPPRPETT